MFLLFHWPFQLLLWDSYMEVTDEGSFHGISSTDVVWLVRGGTWSLEDTNINYSKGLVVVKRDKAFRTETATRGQPGHREGQLFSTKWLTTDSLIPLSLATAWVYRYQVFSRRPDGDSLVSGPPHRKRRNSRLMRKSQATPASAHLPIPLWPGDRAQW